MKKYLFSTLFVLLFCIFQSCTENELSVNTVDAEQQGRADAEALCRANYAVERDLHAALLAVKSREFEMRRSGDTIGASAYINAFKEQLRESDSKLANDIL